MRLVEILENGELCLRQYAADKVPPYAILSHTWSEDNTAEVVYQDLVSGTAPSKPQWRKLELCRIWAAADQLKHFWIDTCCIDQSNSPEVNESINSMFTWYRCARKCYVYLDDLVTGSQARHRRTTDWAEALLHCRWFSRGWTLQELLAPSSVQFFSADGTLLGDKVCLESGIQQVTGIPFEALRGAPVQSFSVAERFRWAERRQTTRSEDLIYCLLGIFEVSMALIYGEGYKRARERLEFELEKLRARDSQVLNWLSTLNFAEKQQDLSVQRAPGTGSWFLQHGLYLQWLEGGNQTLFCPGMPGAGKTMIAAAVIESVQRRVLQQNAAIAYAFCAYGDSNTQRAVLVMGAILKQLGKAHYPALQLIHRLHEAHLSRETQPTLDDIRDSLIQVCNCFSQTFIVVDALDECHSIDGERTLLVGCLLKIQQKAKVSLLFTSRFLPILEESLGTYSKISIEAHSEDIETYIVEQIPHLPGFVTRSEELQKQICDRVVASARGMFLLVKFYIDSLRHKTTARKLKAALIDFGGPEPLKEAYDQALHRINHQAEEYRDLARQVLIWMNYAKEPLTIDQLRHALAIEAGDAYLDPENMPETSVILSTCAGLVTIDENSQIVRLVHYTTKEFLQTIQEKWISAGQEYVATCCVAYLSLNEFETGPCAGLSDYRKRRRKYKFLEYAASHWDDHLRPVQRGVDYDLVLRLMGNHRSLDACLQALTIKWAGLDHTNRPEWPVTSCLHLASYLRLEQIVEKLLQAQSCLVDQQDEAGNTPLMFASGQGHVGIVRKLLLTGAAGVNKIDMTGETAVFKAISTGHVEASMLLLEHELTDLSLQNHEGETVLMVAAGCGHVDIVNALLTSTQCDANTEDHQGRTALLHAAYEGQVDVLEELLRLENIHVNHRDKKGWTALMLAAQNGHTAVVSALLRHSHVLPDMKLDDDCTALMLAVQEDHSNTVRALTRSANIDVNCQDKNGSTALIRAAALGSTNVVPVLLEDQRVDVNMRTLQGHTALSECAAFGQLNIVVLLLLTNKVDNDAVDICNRSALHDAVAGRHYHVVKQLASLDGINLNRHDTSGETPLLTAARLNATTIVKCLLETGQVDVMSRDRDGRTALFWTNLYHNVKLKKALLGAGAEDMRPIDLNARNAAGLTPLLRGVECHDSAAIRALLRAGTIHVNEKDPFGRSALALATSKNLIDIALLLLDYDGIEVDCKDHKGRTPLMNAAKRGHIYLLDALLTTGKANVNAQDAKGFSPLMLALAQGHVEAVERLLATDRVNVCLENEAGDTARDLLMSSQHELLEHVRMVLWRHLLTNSASSTYASSSRLLDGQRPLEVIMNSSRHELSEFDSVNANVGA